MNSVFTIIIWIIINLFLVAFMDLALFSQTTFKEKDTSIVHKLITSEFWATLEWILVIPSQRIGYTFLNPAQLDMSSYVFNIFGQIVSNNFWLNIPTLIDDYIGMSLILIGMYITIYKVFG
jgi:uncharacterized protein (DUF486 family)